MASTVTADPSGSGETDGTTTQGSLGILILAHRRDQIISEDLASEYGSQLGGQKDLLQ